jgi:hypothetical protein
MSRPLTPAPGEVNPWALLGFLESQLAHRGKLTVDMWDAAVRACTKVDTEITDDTLTV